MAVGFIGLYLVASLRRAIATQYLYRFCNSLDFICIINAFTVSNYSYRVSQGLYTFLPKRFLNL